MIDVVVVVSGGPDRVAGAGWAASVAAEVHTLATVDPASLDAPFLRTLGHHVDPSWCDPGTGRPLTRHQAARVLAHEQAGRAVAAAGRPGLVVEAAAALADDLASALDEVGAAVGHGWDVLHLDAERAGLAYALTPAGAEALLASAPAGLVPLDVVLASAPVDAFVVTPPVARRAGIDLPGLDPDPDDVLVDHLRVLEVEPGRDVVAAAVAAAGEAADGTVVLAVPAGRARVVAHRADVLGAFATLGAPTVVAPGPVVAGTAAALASGVGAEPVAEAPGLVVHVTHPTDVVVLGGRVRDAARGVDAAVVSVDDPDLLDAVDADLADAGQRDLVALLRYEGAADRRGGWSQPAPDILQAPFWLPSFCAAVVRAAEATGAFAPDDDDPVPGHEVSLAAISPRLFAHLEDDLAVRVVPALQQVWRYVDYHGLRDAFVIKYAPGVQESLRVHHDVAQLSATVKLNDGYDGAVLEFERQAWSNAAVPVGHLVVWPSLVTHPHRTTPLQRGVKYGLTVWFELPGS